MKRLMEKYLDWCTELKPSWVGYVLWMTVGMGVLMLTLAAASVVIYQTDGWALLVVPCVPMYALYIALFKQ